MALPRFGPKVFRNAALGLGALAVATLPFAVGLSRAENDAINNRPTIAATIGSSETGKASDVHRAVAQDTPRTAGRIPVAATPSSVPLVDDAGLAANRYSRENPGIAIAIHLGTHPSTPTPARIKEVLSSDFRTAGVEDPVVFLFDKHDAPP